MTEPNPEPISEPHGDPQWFREPSRREHKLGAWLFIAFGVFFVALFFLHVGWWFRWVILVLGVWSIIRGVRHMIGAIGVNERSA